MSTPSTARANPPANRLAIHLGRLVLVLIVATVFMSVYRNLRRPVASHIPGQQTPLRQRSSATENGSAGDASAAVWEHPVVIRRPTQTPRVKLGVFDAAGTELTAACSSCHHSRQSSSDNQTSADLQQFHQGLTFRHGAITCLSCHNKDDYDTLALANGRSLPYADVMQLCAQCHGPQTRDYEHGAHGGMSGHWDLSRGPRSRNNCIDCHDPHAPQFPHMKPRFKPIDRFLDSDHSPHSKESHAP